MSIKSNSIFLFLSILSCSSKSQQPDTTIQPLVVHSNMQLSRAWVSADYKIHFPVKKLIIPALLVGYGFTAIENDGLKNLNEEVKEEVFLESPHKKTKLDNYLQFAPAVAVYGLNMAGIKGAHNFVDRSALYLLSNVFVTSGVYAIKHAAHQLRPDGSAYSSFPSGHTAEAFASAEFLRLEYKDVSPWYGIAGYAVAATTGYLRMYNNKHWMSDIVAGAGMGIASTQIAYWLYPKIKHVFVKNNLSNTTIMPTYQNRSVGFALVHSFSR